MSDVKIEFPALEDLQCDAIADPWEFAQRLLTALTTLTEANATIARQAEAFDDMRDSVLRERHGLAELSTGNDSINAVLGIMDDAWTANRLKEPS